MDAFQEATKAEFNRIVQEVNHLWHQNAKQNERLARIEKLLALPVNVFGDAGDETMGIFMAYGSKWWFLPQDHEEAGIGIYNGNGEFLYHGQSFKASPRFKIQPA